MSKISAEESERLHTVAAGLAVDPESASDSDRLRVLAWWLDMQHGFGNDEIQDWLRDLADRLEK